MHNVIEKHDKVKILSEQINQISAKLTSNKIIFFKGISIQVSYSSVGACYNELLNWFYAMFIEVCGPNVKFFEDRMKALGMITTKDIVLAPMIVHTIRTVNSHNLDYSVTENDNKRKFAEDWYIQIIDKIKPENDEDYLRCCENLLDKVIEYLKSLFDCITAIANDEFFEEIILPEWQRRNDRDYGIYDFEVVFDEQLKLFEINAFLDTNKIVKREISKWKEELKSLRDGFDFKIEAARIIRKYIISEKYSPVDAKDLIDIGVPKGKELRDLSNTIAEEFYREPRSKGELLVWAKEQGLF